MGAHADPFLKKKTSQVIFKVNGYEKIICIAIFSKVW